METVIEFLTPIIKIIGLLAGCAMLLFIAGYVFFLAFVFLYSFIDSWIIEPIRNFFKKRKEPIQPPAPLPCEECKKLEAECNRLRDEIKRIQAEHDTEPFLLRKRIAELENCLEDYDGETIKAEFDNIILSFIKSKHLAPNVSIEHLTNLCNVSEANDRFFRALLHDFEIQSLTVTKENKKHNITMEIKSGDNTYITTLTDCTCKDFYNYNGQKVCKHMYFLAITIGLISSRHYMAFQKSALDSLPKQKIKSLKKK